MNQKEFEGLIARDSALATPVFKAAKSITPRTRGTFGAAELAGIALLFPVVKYIIKNFGLPWLHEAKRYSELWRQKFHNWVNEQYSKHGMDPDEIEAAGETLVKELEATTDSNAQKSWERLAGLLEKE